MKTVYDHFLNYASSLLKEQDDACKKNVFLGIKAFLSEMDMVAEEDPDGNIARRELVRFRMMPAETFVLFFDNYEVRSQILQFRRECELLAINRIKNNTTITMDAKSRKLREFYDLTAELALDKRYTSWIDDIAYLVQTDLAFATGKSNAISRELADWLAQNS